MALKVFAPPSLTKPDGPAESNQVQLAHIGLLKMLGFIMCELATKDKHALRFIFQTGHTSIEICQSRRLTDRHERRERPD